MWSIIIFVLLALIAISIVIVSFLSYSVIDKKNFIYFIPLLIVNTIIYLVAYKYAFGDFAATSFLECLGDAFAIFGFKIEEKTLLPLMNDDVLFRVDVYTTSILSGLTLISSLLSLAKSFFLNQFRIIRTAFKKDVTIVLGYNEEAINFAKKAKHPLLYIDSSIVKLKKEDREKLFLNRLPYVYGNLKISRIQLLSLFTKKLHIVSFYKESNELSSLRKAINGFTTKDNKNYYFHIFARPSDTEFINDQFNKMIEEKDNIYLSSFNVYDLISLSFAEKHNLASYLPSSFMENGCIKEGKKINVVMLGAGKTSLSLFRNLVVNNQFAAIENGQYKAKPVNYLFLDKSDENYKKSDFIKRIIEIQEAKQIKGELPILEPLANVEFRKEDVYDFVNEANIEKYKNEDEFTYFIVALDEAVKNQQFAERINFLRGNFPQFRILYNIDSAPEKLLGDDDFLLPIGFKFEILSPKFIINENLIEAAKKQKDNYDKKSGRKIDEFRHDDYIDQLSNVYRVLNFEFKLNLLSLTSYGEGKAISEDEFKAIYLEGVKDESDVFSLNTRNALMYVEHLRWNAFMTSFGIKPMKLGQIVYKRKGNMHKDLKRKVHGCLTSFKGLDELHKYEEKLCIENNDFRRYKDLETFKYDIDDLNGIYTYLIREGRQIRRK